MASSCSNVEDRGEVLPDSCASWTRKSVKGGRRSVVDREGGMSLVEGDSVCPVAAPIIAPLVDHLEFVSAPTLAIAPNGAGVPVEAGSAPTSSASTVGARSCQTSALAQNCSAVTIARGVARSTDRYDIAGIVPGAATKIVGTVAGLVGLGVGYGLISKVEAAFFGTDLADSKGFQAACASMLFANGIFPTVVVEDASYERESQDGKLGSGSVSVPRLLDNDDEWYRTQLLRAAPIIVCNHVSYIDAVVLPVVLRFPRFLSKSDVKQWPIFGVFGQELDYVWVDRKSKDSRTAAAQAISDHAERWQPTERPLVVFPEGTTSSGKHLLPFRPGAFIPGKPVLPVVVKYTGAWDPSNPDFREADVNEFINNPDLVAHEEPPPESAIIPYAESDWVAQFLGHLVHRCVVYICGVYKPTSEEIADPNLYMENVQRLMALRLDELHEALDGWDPAKTNEMDARGRIRAWRSRRGDQQTPSDGEGDLVEARTCPWKRDSTWMSRDRSGRRSERDVPKMRNVVRRRVNVYNLHTNQLELSHAS